MPSWLDSDPVVEDEPKAGQGDWWKSDPVIGEEPSDTFAQVTPETAWQPQTAADLMSSRFDALPPEQRKAAMKRIHIPTINEVGIIPAPIIEAALKYASPVGWAQMASEAIEPGNAASRISKGVTSGAANTLAGFTTPEGLQALAIMPQSRIGQILLGLGFEAKAVADVPAQVKAYGATDDPQEKAKIATEIAASVGLPAMAVAHGVSPRAELPQPNPQAVPMARETQAPSGESLTRTPSEMVREGPPSAEDAKGLPISRPVTQRFVQPEGNPVVPESETTAAITRDALAWRNELLREGQRLGEQARLMGQMGQPIPKPLADRITEINGELARGFQPKPQEHYELRGETEQVAAQSDTAATPQSPVRSADNRTQSETVAPSGVVRQTEAAFVPESVPRPETSTPEVESASPNWLQQNQDALAAIAERSGVADKIEQLHADRFTAAQIASQLGVDVSMVRAVRTSRGLPERTDAVNIGMSGATTAPDSPAFTQWVEARSVAKEEPVASEASTANPVQEAPAPGTTTGVANRVLKAEADAGRIEPVEPGEGMSWQEMVDLGREKLNAGADPQMIARRFQRNGRISAEDFAVVRAERERLAGETMAAENAVRQSPNDVSARNNYNAARQTETEWVRNVVQPAKTATSDIFRGMQGEAPIDPTTFAGLRRAVLDIHGRDVAPNEVQTLSAISERTRRAVAESSESLQRAATAVENTLGRKVRPRSIEELREHLANRIREITPCP